MVHKNAYVLLRVFMLMNHVPYSKESDEVR